jgi:methionine-rich copper-binding protein CopC
MTGQMKIRRKIKLLFIFLLIITSLHNYSFAQTFTSPPTNSVTNATLDIDFTLPEIALTGTVKMTFTNTGGNSDDNAPHVLIFGTDFETAGQHTATLDGTDLSNNVNVDSVNTDENDTLINGAVYSVKIEYQDTLGNPASSVTNTNIIYDSSSPSISSLAPSDNSDNVSTYSNLQIEFNESVYSKSGNITLYKTGNTVVEIFDVTSEVSGSGTSTIIINPTSDLESSTDYYIQIDTVAFGDFSGNLFEGITDTTTWNFSSADVIEPAIVSLSPADNSTGNTLTGSLEIEFSENIIANTGNITIYQADNDLVIETINVAGSSVEVTDNAVTIFPSTALLNGTTYYIIIDNGAFRDISTNNWTGINSKTTWNYTTMANSAPAFTVGGNDSIFEDNGPRILSSWIYNIDAGHPSESSQNLSFTVTNNSNTLFSEQPTIDPLGNLSYTPAADTSGTALVSVQLFDDGGTLNGGVDSSGILSFTITVSAVNDAPSFTKGDNIGIFEDAEAQTFSGWATNIVAGPPDETSQQLSFSVSNNNTPLFSVQPEIDASGLLSFTPAANANGTAEVFVYLSDDGGDINGGKSQSMEQLFSITISAVNDPPTFTGGADIDILENANSQVISTWATNISSGPENENNQSLLFYTRNDNNSLFVEQPYVGEAGELVFTAQTDLSGIAIVDVKLTDNGGIDNGGIDSSAIYSFIISVGDVNNPPSFIIGTNQEASEDAGPQTVDGWATEITSGASNEDNQILSFSVTNDNTNLFSVQPAVDSNGRLTYTTAPDSTGSAIVSVQLFDDGGIASGGIDSSGVGTFEIIVSPVNDAPSFIISDTIVIAEDAGAQTFTEWATDIKAGPPNEADQEVEFTVNNDNNALFSVQPQIAPNGTLTFTTATDSVGKAIVEVQLGDNGKSGGNEVNTSNSITFSITVNGINDAPSFTAGTDQSTLEDSQEQTVQNWATDILPGFGSDTTQSTFFVVTNNNADLFIVQPSIDSTGTLTYTPAPDSVGVATVSVQLFDDGGTDNGGVDSSGVYSLTLTITAVNDAPSFTTGENLIVLENSGSHTFNNWATNISTGPADEKIQSVNFILSDIDSALYSTPPAIDSTGTLSFSTLTNAVDIDTIKVQLSDDGGIENGGIYTSEIGTFTISIDGVNNKPEFTMGSDQETAEDAGPIVVNNWATNISKGPADESGQTLRFVVTNDNNGLFYQQPAIDDSGTLTYTAIKDLNGDATVSVQVFDDGGTDNNGVDSTDIRTFTISISEVNDAPSFATGPNINTTVGVDMQEYQGWARAIVLGPDNESYQTYYFTVTNSNNSLFEVQPAIDSNGNLTYKPNNNFTGKSTLSVQLFDSGGDLEGENYSKIRTFTITVNPIDDVPTVHSNKTLIANNGSQTCITSIHLNAIDYEINNGAIIYNITTPPVNGKIIKSGNPGISISTFTQQEIYDENIEYLHNGSYTFADTLSFSISDGRNVLKDQLFCIAVNTTVSVKNSENIEVNIWPNPVADKLFVQSAELISQINIYNISGNLLINSLPYSNAFSIDLSVLNHGHYIVVIQSDNKHYVNKIIKN